MIITVWVDVVDQLWGVEPLSNCDHMKSIKQNNEAKRIVNIIYSGCQL